MIFFRKKSQSNNRSRDAIRARDPGTRSGHAIRERTLAEANKLEAPKILGAPKGAHPHPPALAGRLLRLLPLTRARANARARPRLIVYGDHPPGRPIN